MLHEKSCGAIVYRRFHGNIEILLIKHINSGHWSFPKGHVEGDETELETARREIKEETGLDVEGAKGGYLFSYMRENPKERDNYFVDIYRYEMDITEADVRLQEEETDGYMFATVEQIKEFAEQGVFLHYDSIKQAFEL